MDCIIGLRQFWRNWRREDLLINSELSSHVIWHKHIKMNTDAALFHQRDNRVITRKVYEDFQKDTNLVIIPDMNLPMGRRRIKLKHKNTQFSEHEKKLFLRIFLRPIQYIPIEETIMILIM